MDDLDSSKATDSSGNGNHGTLLNGVVFVEGRQGGGASAHTRTANQHIRVQNSASLNTPTSRLSVAAWVNPGTQPFSGFQTVAMRQLGTASNDQWILTLNSGRPLFLIATVSGVTLISAESEIPLDSWTHLAGTYDGRNARLYVNGVEVATSPHTGSLAISNRDLVIGAGTNDDVPNSAEEWFAGRIDDLVLAYAAFTPAQVQSLATDAPLPPDVAPDPLGPGGTKPILYLTFDDGPEPPYTQQLLTLFAEHEVKATFFVVGPAVAARPAMVNDILAAGHAIGNHTWTHPALPELTRAQITDELVRTSDAIEAATGGRPTCMRPPFGAMNQTARDVSAELGLDVIIWDLAVFDGGAGRPAAEIVEALDTAEGGMVVNMHDGGGDRSQTVAALETWLAANGDRFDFRVLPTCQLLPSAPTP